ncbi:MAG: pilus assembly protein [Chloroflexi bacterium]|nr:pilus assembly protein [Chloroflexota bacterium]
MNEQRCERGQGLVELAIILPILLLLLIGLVEIGYLLRNYLVVVNADREACRYAARGRYDDDSIVARAVSAAGPVRIEGQDVWFLRTHGASPNAAVIVTHIPMSSTGGVVQPVVVTCDPGGIPNVSVCISGTVYAEGGVHAVEASDSGISLTTVILRHSQSTQDINATREAAGYDRKPNDIVVVEVFYMHYPMFDNTLSRLSFGIVPEAPWLIRTDTEMRVSLAHE